VGDGAAAGGVRITINLGGQELGTATVIDATPQQIESDPHDSDPD